MRLRFTRSPRGLESMDRVAEALTARPEVTDVHTSHRTGSLVLRYDTNGATTSDLHAALDELGVTLLTAPDKSQQPAPAAGVSITAAASRLNQVAGRATGGTDLRLLVPLGLGALSLRQVVRDAPGLRQAPWYVLAWYASETFLKFRDSGQAAPGEASRRRGER